MIIGHMLDFKIVPTIHNQLDLYKYPIVTAIIGLRSSKHIDTDLRLYETGVQ